MTDPTKNSETEVQRRDVLKQWGAATGALVVGGTALSGTAAAKGKKTGGMTALTFEYQVQTETPFIIRDILGGGEFPASFQNLKAELKQYQLFYGDYVGDEALVALAVREERAQVLADAFGTDEKFELTPAVQETDQLGQPEYLNPVRVTIKPV